ncbi:hypothetical protein [Pedobacter duraquae]|uniref:Uncharacterized protein n=1 Tax=Pedobacter duraquae TaxID=425511 RepID=A0A4R6ILL1_9SPHI|nr:hypothetical protein [Pedobacter duraquae]TDO22951.1 hypothetical protein CLV32_1936 [Pedobacter duraquae]
MKLFLILFILFPLQMPVRQLPDLFVPKGYTQVLETEGDLDKDGIKEHIYVFDTDKTDGELGFFRVLYICKSIGGKIKLWKKNTSVLRSSKNCGFCLDDGIDLSVTIKNNTLIIAQTFNHNSRHYSTVNSIFRYQHADWFLIGSTYNLYDTCEFDFTYDINFSTKKVEISENYGDCDENKKIPEDKSYSFNYPFKGIPRMDGFKPGDNAIKVPNSKKYFLY